MRSFTAVAALAALSHAPIAAQPTETTLRQADAEQMRIIVDQDVEAQKAFMHPNYIINTPANQVDRKDQIIARFARGGMASESFERTIEGSAITGQVGIVMGRETVKPAPGSQLGRLHPGKTLNRRFTNVFLWEDGKWRFLARQATVVTP
jgi:hypothetical protein